MALHREAETLTLSLIDGADRAFGGVEEATFEKGVLQYTKSLTPLALYHLWCAFSKAPQEAGLDISSLVDCAVCQASYASYEVPDKDLPAPPQEKHIVHFYLSRSVAPNVLSVSDPNTFQDCFDQILEEYENRGMTEFLWEDLDGFFQEGIAFYKKQSLFKPKTLRSSGRTKKSAIKRREISTCFPIQDVFVFLVDRLLRKNKIPVGIFIFLILLILCCYTLCFSFDKTSISGLSMAN